MLFTISDGIQLHSKISKTNEIRMLATDSLTSILTQSATMLIYGQLYSLYSMKTLFMGSLSIFVVGSVLTAAAPTSPAFIVGRALSGFGSAGAFAGTTM